MSKTYLGIDITATSVRIVGVAHGKKPVFLGCKELSLLKGEETEHVFDEVYIGEIIRQALKEAAPKPLKPASAIILIPESEIFRKILEVPLISNEDELSSAIRLQVAEFLPQSSEESEIDYQILDVLADGKNQHIMVVAAPTHLVEQYTHACTKAKVPLKAVDVRSIALGRSIIEQDEKKALIIVHTEGEATAVSLHQGGLVRATSSIATRNNEESDDAERVKELLTALTDEIDHLIKFYANRTANHVAVKEVRLAASGSWLPDLKKALAKELDMTVTLAKPVIAVPAFCDSRFLAALGGALYGIDSNL